MNAKSDPETGNSPDFRVELQSGESANVLVLAGALNLDAATRLREVALEAAASAKDVLIDWSEAGHVSAGALQVLPALRTSLAAAGRNFAVSRDNPGVRRTLELAGLSAMFPVREAPE